ncbi:CRR6 family NdhI maturation factor [Synechococcus sp. H60.3]|uniref:CRR6 family NdhI maturation factor n=1 Tax=Synechococcus sp. H60.3 TaxID=2967124 RepID=UPI0039C25806
MLVVVPITFYLPAKAIQTLDLTPGHELVKTLMADPVRAAQQVQCSIDWPRSPDDPRELSEIPEVRLWFIRWDTVYPWMPYFLDWRSGELARYAAMLVPHQFNPREGIVYNPEALEIFVYQKIFVLMRWFKQQKLGSVSMLRDMALVFGFEVQPEFLNLWEAETGEP